ncbi:MAG TPA: DsbA family oxidoreductase, partial [Lysobacter sp.]|nr:DsbA family oxidoreductase [Lysobacter sp.]
MTAAGAPLRIDFVSDVVCPWCAIGLAALEQALERIGDDVQAEIHFQPFELNPRMPPEGEPTAEHLRKKYGLTDAQLAENQERIRQRGAELGFTFAKGGRSRIVNTFDAHRLLHWAGIEGPQAALKHALLVACFTDDRDVSDHDTLVAIAGSVGLPEDRAREILASDTYADDVRAAEQMFQRSGIDAVPAVIINR